MAHPSPAGGGAFLLFGQNLGPPASSPPLPIVLVQNLAPRVLVQAPKR